MPAFIPESEVLKQKYGKWTPLKEVEKVNNRRAFLCRCDCGRERVIKFELLPIGRSTSCGACGKPERKKQSWHGMSRTPEYRTWQEVIRRCCNPNRPFYMTYGGRGITICDRWKNSFEAFLEDMGKRPSPQHSIERIDVNGNYEPSNCKWATPTEQARNKRTNVSYVFNGKGLTLPEWEQFTNIPAETMRTRIEVYGWTIERALTEPVNEKCNWRKTA